METTISGSCSNVGVIVGVILGSWKRKRKLQFRVYVVIWGYIGVILG